MDDQALWETWAEFPYQGTPDGAMLHSINVDPRERSHLYIALSSGGVFESDARTNGDPQPDSVLSSTRCP